MKQIVNHYKPLININNHQLMKHQPHPMRKPTFGSSTKNIYPFSAFLHISPICETIAFRLNSKDTKGLLCDICALHTFQASLSSFTSTPC